MKGVHEAAVHMLHEGVTQDETFVMTFKRLLNRVRESDVLIYTAGMNTASGVFAKGRADRSQLEEPAEVTD